MEKLLDYLNKRDILIDSLEGAKNASCILLKNDNENRYKHTLRVVENVKGLLKGDVLNKYLSTEEKETLLMAAYLHDIGYYRDFQIAHFHAYDGFTYLRANDWNHQICRLVLHHSFSQELSELICKELKSIYKANPLTEREQELNLILTIADFKADGEGNAVSFDERLGDIKNRHGEDNPIYTHALEVVKKCRESEALFHGGRI